MVNHSSPQTVTRKSFLKTSTVRREAAANFPKPKWLVWTSARKAFARAFFFVLVATCADSLRAQDIGVGQLRAIDPMLTGTGVRVAQAEAVYTGTNGWEVTPSATGQPTALFSYFSGAGSATTFANAVGSPSGHAAQVGDICYGMLNTASPEGVAYGVSHVDNYEAGYFYNKIVAFRLSIPAKVVNQSFIFAGQNSTVDRDYDNFVAVYGTVFVSGVGNAGGPNSPATAYNSIGVAAYGGTTSVGPTTDGRSKPDITAPEGATSYSTPIVTGAAAILIEAGNRLGGTAAGKAIDPRTVKALLLNGAAKQPGWTHTSTAPLDTYQGAGVVNVFNAYQQLVSGTHAFTASDTSQTPPTVSGTFNTLSGWDFNSLTSSGTANKVNHYIFDVNASQGSAFTVTSTLVWNKQNGKTSINNLDLFLYSSSGALVASSVSSVDNVEHLYTSYLAPGRYDLQVVKRGVSAVSNAESYALAFKFSPDSALTAGIAMGSSNATVRFPSIVGHTYRVEWIENLASGSWATLSDNIAGTGSAIEVIDPGALNQEQRFYRVKLLQ